jgi:hypothetical protein
MVWSFFVNGYSDLAVSGNSQAFIKNEEQVTRE